MVLGDSEEWPHFRKNTSPDTKAACCEKSGPAFPPHEWYYTFISHRTFKSCPRAPPGPATQWTAMQKWNSLWSWLFTRFSSPMICLGGGAPWSRRSTEDMGTSFPVKGASDCSACSLVLVPTLTKSDRRAKGFISAHSSGLWSGPLPSPLGSHSGSQPHRILVKSREKWKHACLLLGFLCSCSLQGPRPRNHVPYFQLESSHVA